MVVRSVGGGVGGGVGGSVWLCWCVVVLSGLLLSSFAHEVAATPTTSYLYLNHTTGEWRASTSRANGEYFLGPGCGASDQPGDADLAWQVGGCSGPVASAEWKPDLLNTGWDELTVTTSARFDDRTQAFGAGYLEGWLTHERIYSLAQTLIRKRTVDPKFVDFITKQDAFLRKQVQQNAPVVFEHGNSKLQGSEPEASEDQSFWFNVGLTLRQLDGLLAGYNARAPANRQLTLVELWQLNEDGDKMDILRAIAAENKKASASSLSVGSKTSTTSLGSNARFAEKLRSVAEMSEQEVLELIAFNGHCSALVRFTGDDLIVGHNTWSDYDLFLRIVKSFDFNYHHASIKAQGVSFTSYPGFLSSSDDFYTTSRGSSLVLTETTITILDESLYLQHVGPEKGVLAWVRNQVANRRASSGSEWVSEFSKHNSGTYNDAWMVVDMAVFERAKQQHQSSHSSPPQRRSSSLTPTKSPLKAAAGTLSVLTATEALSDPVAEAKPHTGSLHGGLALLPGTLFLLEQIPGYIETRDVTSLLQEAGYFAGYNLPFTKTIAQKSMYAVYAAEFDTTSLEYATSSRAQIFAQEAPKVVDVAGMKALMRLNDFQLGDKSLTKGCPAAAVAARYDVAHLPGVKCEIDSIKLNGAIDGKVVDAAMVRQRRMELISGPVSSPTLPPFDWNSPSVSPSDRRQYRSAGSPIKMDFPWISVVPGKITPLPQKQPQGTQPKKQRNACSRAGRPAPVRRRVVAVAAPSTSTVTPVIVPAGTVSNPKAIRSPQDRQKRLKERLGKKAKKEKSAKKVKAEIVERKNNLTKAILRKGHSKQKKQAKKLSKAAQLAMQLLEQQGE